MSDSFYTEYQYANGSTAHSTSNLISGVTQKLGEDSIVSYSYEYNDNEDVEYILEDGERVACYTYGDMNQLSYYADENTGIYKHFYYDNVGNITGVTDYRLLSYGWIPGSEIESHTYTYGDNNWKDKLTKYDNQTITYDENGNPLQYRDGMSFTWINGRILDTVTVDNDTIEMQYDYNGMRTQKGNTQYYYDSENRLIGMTKGSHTLLFYYDENGNPTAFTDNGTIYFYIRNLQGDIVKIVNSSGAVVVNYIYDALGKKLSVKDASDNEITDLNSLALLNPLRYRGYVYDDETGLYYLQSRYYDPLTGRFLNADSLFDTVSGTPLSTNMFAYCENNSVMRLDLNGSASYYWNKRPSISDKMKECIKNSGLNNVNYSVFGELYYTGYNLVYRDYYVYRFQKLSKNLTILYSSEYYIMRKTFKGWSDYESSRWGPLNFIFGNQNVSVVYDLFSFYESNPYIILVSQMMSVLASWYPKVRNFALRRLLKQMSCMVNEGKFYYICHRVRTYIYCKNRKGKYQYFNYVEYRLF